MYHTCKIHVCAKTFNNSPNLETQMPIHSRMGKSTVESSHSNEDEQITILGGVVAAKCSTGARPWGCVLWLHAWKVGDRLLWRVQGGAGQWLHLVRVGVVIRKETTAPEGCTCLLAGLGAHYVVCLCGNDWAAHQVCVLFYLTLYFKTGF